MKEDEYLAAAERGPSIERRAAIARTGDDAIGEGICQQRGAVAAAAIDDDHFSAAAMIAASSSTGMTIVSRPMAGTLPAKPQSGNLA